MIGVGRKIDATAGTAVGEPGRTAADARLADTVRAHPAVTDVAAGAAIEWIELEVGAAAKDSAVAKVRTAGRRNALSADAVHGDEIAFADLEAGAAMVGVGREIAAAGIATIDVAGRTVPFLSVRIPSW